MTRGRTATKIAESAGVLTVNMIDVAKAFGVSVKRLAEFLGYSRQAMYLDELKENPRSLAAVQHLKMLDKQMLERDMEEALIRQEYRIRAINEFASSLVKEGAE